MKVPSFRIVIPARLESSRLPRKVLLPIAGKPMLQHVWERSRSSNADEVIIATDSKEVAEVARAFGADVCMTSENCQSGTDRVAEVSQSLGWGNTQAVVNVQGDAPLIPPDSINSVAKLLFDFPDASLSTLCVPVSSEESYRDPNVVKVVFDAEGRALYFSRAPIPAAGHGGNADTWRLAWRHLGLYGYRVSALQKISATPPCALEQTERLEQLRALWLGMDIRVVAAKIAHGPDVDTAADLAYVEKLLALVN